MGRSRISLLSSVLGPLVAAALIPGATAAPPLRLPPGLAALAGSARAIIALQAPADSTQSWLRHAFDEYLRSGENLDQDLRKPEKDRPVTVRRLYEAPGEIAIVVVIRSPGAPAPIHDHPVWLMTGVLAGEEKETLYEVAGASDEEFESLDYRTSRLLRKGSPCVRLARGEIHKVENTGRVPSITIQIIGGSVESARGWVYDPGLRGRTRAEAEDAEM